MTPQAELLAAVTDRLDAAGIPYMVVGSIAKLERAVAGEAERQLRDVAEILSVSGETLDRAYVERWISELRLERGWHRAEALARDELP